MRDTRKILASVLVVLLAIAVCTVAYASNVTYHSNGKPSSIVTDKGTIHYNDKGIVESVTTPSGTAHYNEDGSINIPKVLQPYMGGKDKIESKNN